MLALLLTLLTLGVVPPTVHWDLTVELDSDGAVPDRVCIVTPMNPDELDQAWFSGVSLQRLVEAGILARDVQDGAIVFSRDAKPDWGALALTVDQAPVREAFEAMLQMPSNQDRCRDREPDGCEPAWEFTPPPLQPKWPWAVMCSPDRSPGDDETVAFVTVRAVDLDLAFTPYVTAFDVFGGGLQIRFDSVRTTKELVAANFQASVGIAGGDVHRVAAVPSFRGRARLPLRPRCKVQRFRLPESVRRDGARARVAILDPPGPHEAQCGGQRWEAPTRCTIAEEDLERGVFETRVPLAIVPEEHRLEILVTDPDDAEAPAVCAARTWSSATATDVLDLDPEQLVLRWRWPCFAETGPLLQCPVATVTRSGTICDLQRSAGSNTCTYRCPTTRPDGRSVGWPVHVDLDQERLGMRWSYALDTLDAERIGTLEAETRRFLVVRGARDPGLTPRWPAWWTTRRGDEITGLTIYHQDEQARIGQLGRPDPTIGSIALAGGECRERVEYRYKSADSASRRYNRRDLDATWPYVEAPAPNRSAFPAMFAVEAGPAVAIDPTNTFAARPWFSLSTDLSWLSFWKRDDHERRPLVLAGLRYFAFLGQRDSLHPDERGGARWVARHGLAVHSELRFDQVRTIASRLTFGMTAGIGWISPFSGRPVDDRSYAQEAIPIPYVAPSIGFHYAWLRTNLNVGVWGPDPVCDVEPCRDEDQRFGAGAWFLVPSLTFGAEI